MPPVLDGELFSLQLYVKNIGLVDWERYTNELSRNRIWRDQKDSLLARLMKEINVDEYIRR